MSARHGYATCGHSNQWVDTHEASYGYGHQVLHGNDEDQQDKHDDEQLASLLDDLQIALVSYAGKKSQHEDIFQCAIERHLYIETPIE